MDTRFYTMERLPNSNKEFKKYITFIALACGLVLMGTVALSFYLQTSSSVPSTEGLDTQTFDTFLQIHGKTYTTAAEYNYRFKVYLENLARINQYNTENSSFRLAPNQFADLTNDEYRALYLSSRSDSRIKNEIRISNHNLPSEVDWRLQKAVTDVKDQQSCGSCWAFSATGAVEGLLAISGKGLLSLSEQELVDCSRGYKNLGCDGGSIDFSFDYIKDHGITLEEDYQYQAANQTCQADSYQPVGRISGYVDVPENSSAQLKAAVAQQPVSVAIDAGSFAFQFYISGVLDDSECGTQLSHGVLAVGYGNEDGKDYWLVKNSWGTWWGEEGYVKIFRQDNDGPGLCGIAMAASYPIL
jgi:KDEL-tailed cysteine endopeptidase